MKPYEFKLTVGTTYEIGTLLPGTHIIAGSECYLFETNQTTEDGKRLVNVVRTYETDVLQYLFEMQYSVYNPRK